MTIGEAYHKYALAAKEKGIFSQDVRLIFVHFEGLVSQLDVITEKDRPVKDEAVLEKAMERLLAGEPVEYITGRASFLTRTLKVDPRVLIPRIETEELVAIFSERIADYFNPKNMLAVADIGTGSGCIAMAVKDSFPNFLVYASDISRGALEVARENFADANEQITLLEGDSLEPYARSGRKLDVIISNPPYITEGEYVQPSVKNFEPDSSLFFHEDSNVYKSIIENLDSVRKGPIVLFFEISPELVGYLGKLMSDNLRKYSYEFIEDSNGFTRFLLVDVD